MSNEKQQQIVARNLAKRAKAKAEAEKIARRGYKPAGSRLNIKVA